jgi:hypothetical protein
MKIAMITGGQPRFNSLWNTNFTSLIGEHEIDLYMNLWKEYHRSEVFDKGGQKVDENNVVDLINKNIPDNCTLKRFSHINPPKYEDIIPEDINLLRRASAAVPCGKEYVERFYMQHYALYTSHQMIEGDYDCIIRYRLDGHTEYKINLQNLDLNEGIFTPDSMKYSEHPSIWPEINDQYAIGNMKNMKIYLSLFEHLTEYFRTDYKTFHLETCLSYHMCKNNIKVNSAGFEYRLKGR